MRPSIPLVVGLSSLKSQFVSRSEVSYPAYNFSVPIDHFHNESRYEPHSNGHFNLRYWYDDSFYQPGGPVFVIAAGETDGEDRFPFLSQGIVSQLAETYHGLGVILEHRYYGESYPPGPLDRKSIRFLTTDQALADYAYFASNVVFPGLEDHDLTAASTPWIAYGGSYAGAMVAFLRKLYPDVFWGAVSSSGVTEAIIDYWEYFEPIRLNGPPQCIDTIQNITEFVDRILIDHPDNHTLHQQLQTAFGVKSPVDNQDFADVISYPLGAFQSRNWDPAVGAADFRDYCLNITSPKPQYPPNPYTATLRNLVKIAGYDAASSPKLVTALLNDIGYLNLSSLQPAEMTVLGFSIPNYNTTSTLPRDSGTSWNYQVCTEWGYFATGSSVPQSIRPLVSRLIDVRYLSSFCDPLFGITSQPDTKRINRYGGFNFSYPRVALIGGEADPWRDATPHARDAEPRPSTDSEPYILSDIPKEEVWDGIRGAVHHWDQNGLSAEEWREGQRPPVAIRQLQREIHRFVGVWLKEWKDAENGRNEAGL